MIRIGIRDFNRNMYYYLSKLPLIVRNIKTGRNLFIVKKIVDAHEGAEISLKNNRSSKGTTVTVKFPIVEKPDFY